jgi:competence protein ComEC
VNRVVYGKSSVLLTGDLEISGQQKLLMSKQDVRASVLKVAHHGSKDSFLKDFINKVDPKFAVISVGEKNKFNHPHATVLNGLKGVQIFRTDQDGSVSLLLTKSGITQIK